MKIALQTALTKEDRELHTTHCVEGFESIYGGGCIEKPDVLLLFMNPTARNVSAISTWDGIRAPWLGIRQTWNLLSSLGFIDPEVAARICALNTAGWTESVAEELYQHVAQRKVYITNLAKCTQPDARHLPDSVFRAYLPETYREIGLINPKKIITLGNQVSSVFLQKPISVSHYPDTTYEEVLIGDNVFKVYPTYYPVGQGQRNMAKAVERIQAVMGR